MQNIILFGEMGSGKSEVAKYLCEQYGYTKFSLGEKIHSECKLYKMHDREHLQAYGQAMRRIFHQNIWCDYLYFRSLGIDKIVIDDARQENEFYYFTNKNYLPVAIIADEQIRLDRLQKRVNYVVNPDTSKHKTEVQARICIEKCEIKIYNNYLFNGFELHDEIDKKIIDYLRGSI